jgi:hypothetical protein
VKYAAPAVADYGSISDHTFIHTNSQNHTVHKDHIHCETGHGGSVGSSG